MTRVLVTRPERQADDLVQRLGELGIEALPVPTVEIVPGDDAKLRRAIEGLDPSAWLVVTSANGAAAVGTALAGRPLRDGVRVAAVGPATAEVLRGAGIGVDAVPERYLTAAIAHAMGEVRGLRVLLARADAASPELREALLARGALVEEVTAYRTVEGPAASQERLRRALEEGIDAVLFTSGSTVRGLVALVPLHLRQRVTSIPAVCIGPVTAVAARGAGFWVAAEASEHTATGLAEATVGHFEGAR